MTARPKLGVIAGGGELPARIVASCRAAGRDVFVLALKGQTDPRTVADVDHAWIKIGASTKGLALLRAAGVEELVLAGPVRRPTLGSLTLDAHALRWLAKFGKAALGDDDILSSVVRELETEEGFRVVAADTLLGDALTTEGVCGRHAPDAEARLDIERGVEVARALGAVDVGQSVVVQDGCVLGVEAAEGTDGLLDRCAKLRRDGPGGVLVKICKPGQERRADLPTIGLETVSRAKAVGLRGIAVEAGGSMMIDRDAVTRAADEAGLFLVGIVVPGPDADTDVARRRRFRRHRATR
ncbi:MAG: LpxI family protein [Alphaproteobacteria bacterium]